MAETAVAAPIVHAPSEEVAFLEARALAAAFASGALSPVEVASALVDRIAALDGPVTCVVHLDRDATLAEARAAEARWQAGAPLSPLDGVPITVKDLVNLKGRPKRRGSRLFDPELKMTEDAPCVARLREAGAVFLAKTATPEAGCKIVTRSAIHGATANPYDLARTPGGSSGGASAALAMGFGPLAVGTDGAGSIRIPAAFTNVYGIKPGFGRVPAFPPDSDAPHSVIGPMSRTVADAALMLDVMSRPEPRDPYMWPVPFALPGDLDDPDLSGVRIAVSPRLGMPGTPLIDPETDRLVAEAGPLLADAGAIVEAVDPVWPVDPFAPFKVFWETGCSVAVAFTDPEKRALLDPLILSVALDGEKVDVAGFHRALADRQAVAAAAKAFFNRFDLLIGPVMPAPAFSVERDTPEGWPAEDWSWCPYTYPWNMTGQPAASVPIGFTAAGLPVGVQIIGAVGAEELVLRASAAIERRRPLWQVRPGARG